MASIELHPYARSVPTSPNPSLSLTPIIPFSPVSPALYPSLGMTLTGVGLAITAGYFVFQMRAGNKNLCVELSLGTAASIFLGFGVLFLMLSFDLYI